MESRMQYYVKKKLTPHSAWGYDSFWKTREDAIKRARELVGLNYRVLLTTLYPDGRGEYEIVNQNNG